MLAEPKCQKTAIRNRLGELSSDPKALVAAASQMLSSVTRLAGVVTLPRQSHAALSSLPPNSMLR